MRIPIYLSLLLALPLCAQLSWEDLNAHQNTLTRETFEQRLNERYAPYEAAKGWIEVCDAHALIRMGTDPTTEKFYRLRFLKEDTQDTPAKKHALNGLHIVLDPGHVGDEFAVLESRFFKINDDEPVREGDLNLQVARLAAEKLRARGATVTLTRDDAQPLTDTRGRDFAVREIQARAQKINQDIKPDLVLSIHFDALPWTDPAHPALFKGPSKSHLLVSGCFSQKELADEQQRLHMLKRLLSNMSETELDLAEKLGASIKRNTALPPARYSSRNALPLRPYVWARNLAATRLYLSPTVLCELFVMNNETDYARIQQGRYEGTREINGQQLPNIFEQYAETLAQAVTDYCNE